MLLLILICFQGTRLLSGNSATEDSFQIGYGIIGMIRGYGESTGDIVIWLHNG